MAKKSRRKRAVQRQSTPTTPTPENNQGVPAQPTVKAPSANVLAPKASQPVVRASELSHNLRLELFVIALLGGGAVAILLALSLVQPTDLVARLLHL